MGSAQQNAGNLVTSLVQEECPDRVLTRAVTGGGLTSCSAVRKLQPVIPEWPDVEGTSGGHLVEAPAQERQFPITLTLNECFLMSRRKLFCSSFCPVSLALSWGTIGKPVTASYCTLSSDMYAH